MNMKFVWMMVVASVLPSVAVAQKWELGFYGALPHVRQTPLGSINTDSDLASDKDTSIKGREGYGARVTLNTKGYFGHELSYGIMHMKVRSTYKSKDEDGVISTAELQDTVKVQQASYNFLVYFMPRGERFRPFVTGGATAYRYTGPHFSQWLGGGSKNYGFNYGGGVKIKLVPHSLFRLDARHYLAGKPYQQLSFQEVSNSAGHIGILEASAGISITF